MRIDFRLARLRLAFLGAGVLATGLLEGGCSSGSSASTGDAGGGQAAGVDALDPIYRNVGDPCDSTSFCRGGFDECDGAQCIDGVCSFVQPPGCDDRSIYRLDGGSPVVGLPTCPNGSDIAPVGVVYVRRALPRGLACSASAGACQMAIHDCPDEDLARDGNVSGYRCDCTSGRWACTDVSPGGAICVGDGGPWGPEASSPEGSTGADGGPDADGRYRGCAKNTDCLHTEICVTGTCVPACTGDDQCTGGLVCNASTACYLPPGCDPGQSCPAVCGGACVAKTP